MKIDIQYIVRFLLGLLNTPSPTGLTDDAIKYVQQAFDGLGYPTYITPKGALVITIAGAASDAPRGLTAHADTLGLMVREIKANGCLKVTNIGGIEWHSLDGEGVIIRTFDEKRYRGVVLPINPSSHVNADLRTTTRNADTLEVRLDARTTSARETRALGIDIGDFVFVDPRAELTAQGFIRSRFLDNKAGIAAILGAVIALNHEPPAQDTTILITNYEEVGHGAASGWPSQLQELVTVDMGALGEGLQGDEYSVSICVKDSGGPYHHGLTSRLRRLARQYDIPHFTDIYPFYSSDGTAYWRAGGAAQVALIGPGVSGSHAYERTHEDSIQHTAHLILRYLQTP